eukprot:gene10646-16383_t
MDRYVLHLQRGEKPGMEYMRNGNVIAVKSVRKDSAAYRRGIPVGGIVKCLNNMRIDSPEDLVRALKNAGQRLVVDIEQDTGDRRNAVRQPKDEVVEVTMVTPVGPRHALVRLTPDAFVVTSDSGEREIFLADLKGASLLSVPPVSVLALSMWEGDDVLLSNSDYEFLLDEINKRLTHARLPELPVEDHRTSDTASSSSQRSSYSIEASPESDRRVRALSPLEGHEVQRVGSSFVCHVESVQKLASGHHLPRTIVAEELPDVFAGVKPVLARRGGAIVYFIAFTKEGIVAVGTRAVYRWTRNRGETALARCVPVADVSEMILCSSGLTALRIPKEHDELITLPSSSYECWEMTLLAVYQQNTGHALPVRRLGGISRSELSPKLHLTPPATWHARDPLPLTYQDDLKYPIAAQDFFNTDHVNAGAAAAGEGTVVLSRDPAARRSTGELPLRLVSKADDADGRQRVQFQGAKVPFSPEEHKSPELAAKQKEVASLRALLATKRKEALESDSMLMSPGMLPASASFPLPPALGSPQRRRVSISDGMGSPMYSGGMGRGVLAQVNERESLRDHVDVLSRQLQTMLEELSKLKERERGGGYSSSPAKPPAGTEEEMQINARLRALEGKLRDASQKRESPSERRRSRVSQRVEDEVSQLAARAKMTASRTSGKTTSVQPLSPVSRVTSLPASGRRTSAASPAFPAAPSPSAMLSRGTDLVKPLSRRSSIQRLHDRTVSQSATPVLRISQPSSHRPSQPASRMSNQTASRSHLSPKMSFRSPNLQPSPRLSHVSPHLSHQASPKPSCLSPKQSHQPSPGLSHASAKHSHVTPKQSHQPSPALSHVSPKLSHASARQSQAPSVKQSPKLSSRQSPKLSHAET